MSTASILSDSALRIDTDLDPLTLQPDQAVPLTLLTTEAFTNALKYAGRPAGADRAWVTIALKRNDDGMAELCIRNSLGSASEVQDSTGLGSQLIEAFAMQLDTEAEVTVDAEAYQLRLEFRPQRGSTQSDESPRTVVLTSAARAGARH